MMLKESKEFEIAKKAILKASNAIMKIYHDKDFGVQIKEDDSPVTRADLASNQIILESLTYLFPDYGILSEENFDDKERLSKDYVWIVDPLDGTKDFIAKDDEFAINVALAYKHEIVMGLIMVPAKNKLYYAFKGEGCFLFENGVETRIHTNDKKENLTALVSKRHYSGKDKEYVESYKEISNVAQIGSSYKACLIAEGKAEIQAKFGEGTKEWDIAPMDIIAKEAGGSFTNIDGTNFKYNREDVYNHEGFITLNKYNEKYFVK